MLNIYLDGFYFYFIFNNLDLNLYVDVVKFYFKKVKLWFEKYWFLFKYINFGGGIGVNYVDLIS